MAKPFKTPSKADWWRLNKKKDAVYTIEWTADIIEVNNKIMGGAVRAKLDSIGTWDYSPCSHARYAEAVGKNLIAEQKKFRRVHV